MQRATQWLVRGLALAGASYATYAATTYTRYGNPRRARGNAGDALLDQFMPRYDVCEHHETEVVAPAEVTFAAAKSMRLDSSGIVRGIFRAREVLLRAEPGAAVPPGGLVEEMTSIGWGALAEVPGREIVLGGVTRPWEANPVFRALSPDEFAAFAGPDLVKIVWTLRADPAPEGGSTFRTETRAVATDGEARRKFRPYWSLLSPGITLIRVAMMPELRKAADRAWQLEGDDVFPDARAQFTHAVMIGAPVRHVWPWLLQMGCQRGGWYSWDGLDNGGLRSADRIIPELQHLEVGDVMPWRPKGADGFEVVRIVPDRALVLRSVTPQFQGTWAFVLEPVGAEAARLVTRYRAVYPPSLSMTLRLPVMGAVHGFMERKQLRTIKHHAEAAARA